MDLIERKAALYALCEDCKSKYDGLCPHEASKCIEYRAINRLPAIEAEPVRHGQFDEDKPLTNGDRIRQMTDEELAEWLDNEAGCNMCKKHPTQCDVDCYSGYLEWLRKEVSEDAAD